jgi:hypothetical protein
LTFSQKTDNIENQNKIKNLTLNKGDIMKNLFLIVASLKSGLPIYSRDIEFYLDKIGEYISLTASGDMWFLKTDVEIEEVLDKLNSQLSLDAVWIITKLDKESWGFTFDPRNIMKWTEDRMNWMKSDMLKI